MSERGTEAPRHPERDRIWKLIEQTSESRDLGIHPKEIRRCSHVGWATGVKSSKCQDIADPIDQLAASAGVKECPSLTHRLKKIPSAVWGHANGMEVL